MPSDGLVRPNDSYPSCVLNYNLFRKMRRRSLIQIKMEARDDSFLPFNAIFVWVKKWRMEEKCCVLLNVFFDLIFNGK